MITYLERLDPWRTRAIGWYAVRTKRERVILIAGLAVLLLALFSVLIGSPLATIRDSARADMARYEQLAIDLDAAGPLGSGGAVNREAAPETALTDSAGTAGIDIARLEPTGTGADISIDAASFDALVLWIDLVGQRYGLHVTSLNVERETEPGTVSARISFSR